MDLNTLLPRQRLSLKQTDSVVGQCEMVLVKPTWSLSRSVFTELFVAVRTISISDFFGAREFACQMSVNALSRVIDSLLALFAFSIEVEIDFRGG